MTFYEVMLNQAVHSHTVIGTTFEVAGSLGKVHGREEGNELGKVHSVHIHYCYIVKVRQSSDIKKLFANYFEKFLLETNQL